MITDVIVGIDVSELYYKITDGNTREEARANRLRLHKYIEWCHNNAQKNGAAKTTMFFISSYDRKTYTMSEASDIVHLGHYELDISDVRLYKIANNVTHIQ